MSKVIDRANRILEAALNDAKSAAKNSDDWKVRNAIESIQLHYNGYAEPGYSDPASGLIAIGDWNDLTDWHDGQRWSVSNVPSRIAKLFEKLGIELEWCDEWVECSHCGKLVRCEPDEYYWKPFYTVGDGELWCHECEPEETNEEPDEES
jgi:hypothetical protein